MTVRKIASRIEHTGDRQLDAIQQERVRVTKGVNALPFARGRLLSVSFVAGVPCVVNHGMGEPVSFMAIRGDSVARAPVRAHSLWVERVWQGPSVNTLNNPAGSFSMGNRFTMLANQIAIGIRFPGYNAGASRTYRCKIWRDSDGVVVASGDVVLAGSSTSILVAMFRTPVLLEAGKVYTSSTWDIAGGVYIKSATDALGPLVPIRFDEVVTLNHLNLFSAGDARPATAATTESYWAEPVFSQGELIESIQTGLDPKNQLALVTDRTCTLDVWLYPRASKFIPAGASQA